MPEISFNSGKGKLIFLLLLKLSLKFLQGKNPIIFNFVKFYKGWIPERFKEVENKKFQFVNIDVDLYQPTYDSFEFFFPRLVEGGVIHCDDYNISQFPGCKDAVDEYLKDKKVNLFYESPFGGCFIIK